MQHNRKYRLSGDENETVNYLISECSKLAQKSISQDKAGLRRRSTGNCARNLNLIIRTNGIYTAQNRFWRTRDAKFSEIFG